MKSSAEDLPMVFNAQHGEDIFIYKNFINKPNPSGIFVEVGALDGFMFSTTKFFEDYLNFIGVLIEPSLAFRRLVHNRPNCLLVNKAVSSQDGVAEFIGTCAMSGLVDHLPSEWKDMVHVDSTPYMVATEPLGSILTRAEVPYVDYLSIDVEGAELEVLESMNWNIPVYVISVELHGINKEKDERCREILRNEGFKFKYRLSINEYWCNETYSRIPDLYDEHESRIDFGSHDCISEVAYFTSLVKDSDVLPEIHAALFGDRHSRIV